jgi:hypothetical protein
MDSQRTIHWPFFPGQFQVYALGAKRLSFRINALDQKHFESELKTRLGLAIDSKSANFTYDDNGKGQIWMGGFRHVGDFERIDQK